MKLSLVDDQYFLSDVRTASISVYSELCRPAIPVPGLAWSPPFCSSRSMFAGLIHSSASSPLDVRLSFPSTRPRAWLTPSRRCTPVLPPFSVSPSVFSWPRAHLRFLLSRSTGPVPSLPIANKLLSDASISFDRFCGLHCVLPLYFYRFGGASLQAA